MQLGITQTLSDEDGASDVALPTLDELNAQFPQLEITRLVGRGGMGAIYHARQTALDRDVALKLIAKEVSSDPTFVERFQREAKTLAKLSHPNIVTIFDFGHTPDGTAYLILEYVDGINLREAIASGNVGSDEALELVSTICHALEYAHSKGVVHRDIKPENILLGEDGTLKVADFGIAKIVDDSVRAPTLTATRQVLGSLHYLAPEHLEAPDQVDHRVDLYALGVVFYELLTGQLPLGRYDVPSKVHDRVDQRLDAIVLKSLSRKPQQRYQNAADLDADIGVVATSMKDRSAPPRGNVEADLPPTQDAVGYVSVPFTCDAQDGMSTAVGILHVRGDSLCAEFRIRNVFGYLKPKTRLIEIPRCHLTRLELLPGLLLGAKLVVSADTISVLGDLPNAETGQVELRIKRNDEGRAREVTHALGFDSIQSVDRQVAGGPIQWPNQPSDSTRITFGILMIICGLLNAGAIGVGIYIFANHLTGGKLGASVTTLALILGPLVILQVVTGILNLIGRARPLSLTTSVISMVPLSPVWVISCPVGLWAYRAFMHGGQRVPDVASHNKQGWGTTTLMFLRESRWATTAGLLNTAAGVVAIAAVVAFKLGYYPAELNYRIVNHQLAHTVVDRAVQSRLQASYGVRGTEYDDPVRPSTLTIRTWRCCRDQVDQLLSVQDTPQLVWLEPSGQTDGPPAAQDSQHIDQEQPTRAIPVVSGIDTSSFRIVEQNLGTALQAAGETFELSSRFVGKVSTVIGNDQRQVIIELTSAGREQLATLRGADSNGGLGLIIAGLVEGIATKVSISQKQIVFQLSETSSLSSDSIAAGIRGPSIPTQLELID